MSKGIGIKNNYKLGGSINKATNVQKANVGLLIKAFGKLPVVKEGVKKALTNYRTTNPSKFMERSMKLRAGDVGTTNPSKFLQRSLTLRAGNSSGLKDVASTAKNILTTKKGKVAAAGAVLAGGSNEASKGIKKLSEDESFKKGREEGAKKGKEFSEKVKTKMGEAVGYVTGKKYGGMSKKENKIKKVMGEYKKGELNIGNSKKKVKSRKQAIAIALASAKKKKA